MIYGDLRLPLRFWSKVVPVGECWNWLGAVAPCGYGQINWKCSDGVFRRVSVHRLSFEVANAGIDSTLVIDHLCENKICVNPAHLEQVTSTENTRRHYERHPITHCPAGHELVEGSYYLINNKNGYVRKDCKVCRKATMIAYRQARKAA